MKFTDSRFSRELSPHLNNEEMLLLDKIIAALYPASAFLNIAHQLSLLLTSLTTFNILDLPDPLRRNNAEVISLLTKVTATEIFNERIFNERPGHGATNPIYGEMKEFPVASLFSILFLKSIDENFKKIIYCVLSLVFWISFNDASKLLVEKQSQDLRKFIDKNSSNIKITTSITSLKLDLFIDKCEDLLLRKGYSWGLSQHALQLIKIKPLPSTNKPSNSKKQRLNNVTPIKKINTDTAETTQTRRYEPLLKHIENIAEDNSIELTEISVEAEHYIDEEALDQSYLYGSRLALQELMQLSFRPLALLDYEVSMIINRIKQALGSDDVEQLRGAVLTLLLLCTSKGYEYIEALPIYRNEIQDANTDCICLKTKSWNRFDVQMPDAFTATDDQKEHLEKVDHLLRLPLPIILMTTLEKLVDNINADSITVKELCKGANESFLVTSHITKLFNHVSHIERNITPASIRNLLFEIVSKKETPAIASLLLANTEYAANTSLYYLFHSHRNMVFLYQNSLKELGLATNTTEVNAELFCGSELAIQLWPSKEIISRKYNEIITDYKRIDDRSSLLTLIQIHNKITLYSTLILLITTGHRTRKEYSFSDFTIDEEKELICIADKQNFCDSALRILPLADVVLENLKAYRIHCDRLARLTQKYCPLLTQKLLKSSQGLCDTNQPLLYLINKELTIRPVGYRNIEKYLDMWNLPTNAFRHYFFTFLQNTGARNIAGNMMGHIRSGEHIYANDSLFCNEDLLKKKSAINALAESLNCQSLMLPAKIGRKVPLIHYDTDNVYAPDYLLTKDGLNKRKLRHSVRKLISEAYKDKSTFLKDIPVTKEALLSTILEDEKLNLRELNYKLKMLDKFIIKIVGTTKLPSISKTYADNETTDLRLRTDSLFKAKQAEQLKKALQSWILSKIQNEKMPKNAANREFLKIILSLIVHASFSFAIDVEFIRALKSPLFKDGNILWLAWIDSNKKKQRIFIDAITAQLIINNPVYLNTKLKHPSEVGKTLFHYLSKKIINLPIQKKLIGNKSIDLNKLVQFLNNRFFFTHTGLSQSYLNQKQQTTHLPDEVLTRWLRDSPCHKKQEEETEESVFTPQSLLPPCRAKIDDKSVLLGIKILREIRYKLNQLFSQSGYTSSEMLISIVQSSWGEADDLEPGSNLQQMINQSQRLNEATIAALCWLHHTAGKPGKGRKTIAIKTLLAYLSKVATPLVITANIAPFFTLSKSELQSLYIKVIESRKVKNKNEAAEVLRVFHNYIYDSFKVPKVSWLEIEPSIYSKTSNVRANIISSREYEEILQHLKNDNVFTTDDQLINQTLFSLCYRLGLRISEARNLMVNEVDFENGIIHIKTNRYDRVKTLKSNRRIPMHLFLSTDEINRLKQLVQRILQFNNQKTNIGIFSRPLDHTSLIDFTQHTDAITHAMKMVTHDPSISLHICRHSFANYLYLLVCRGELPPSINNELKIWSRAKDCHQQFNKKLIKVLINEPSSPQKILHAISLLLGHEEIATTIKHYIHVLDIISAAENEKLLNQSLEIKQIKWVNKLSISHANKIVSRFNAQQRLHIAISYHQLKQFKDYVEVDVIRIDDQAIQQKESQHIIKSTNSLLYNLAMFETVLRAAEEKLTINEIVKKVTFSETEVERVIQISEQLKNETAYDGIIVHSSTPKIEFFNNPHKSRKTKAYINTPSYKKLLDNLNALDDKNIASLLRIWRQNYNRKITGYAISQKADRDHFSNIINKLNYNFITKTDSYIVKDDAKKISVSLYNIIDPKIGDAKKSINLKVDHALFLIAINDAFTRT